MTLGELNKISKTIDDKIDRIEWLDDNNYFENKEILALKDEVRELITYLRQKSKDAKVRELGIRLV